jgi:glutamate/tyrosine decarboxylase-like PLP-dependent enzyme
MTQERANPVEETLDPDDWESIRALGHRMLDDMLDYLQTIREHPAWQPMPEEVKRRFQVPVPADDQKLEDIYQEFTDYILPYPLGNIHPRFWGWVVGTGTVSGMLADMLAAGMNPNLAGADHIANYVEKQVIDWLIEMLGFPPSASGLLTSGCSAGNLIGLTVARNTKAGYDLRREGVQAAPQKMVLYAQQDIHSSLQKAVEILGLGGDALHLIPVNDHFQIDLDLLANTIDQDRQRGYLPFCIIGAAGTTNTGAVDDLNALADICQEEDLWLHIDGAFGAWAVLAPEARKVVAGIERVDSLAFDLHKWIYLPYEIGGVLVRSEQDHRNAFSLTAAYLTHGEDEPAMTGGALPWFSDYGFQLSRGFRALKAWMAIKEYGVDKFGRIIQQNIDQAHYLEELIDASSELELMAPGALNVVCFRYVKPGMNEVALDELNTKILAELQEGGIAAPSSTTIRNRYVLHVAHTNHRTLREDFDLLVREVLRIGRKLSRDIQAA